MSAFRTLVGSFRPVKIESSCNRVQSLAACVSTGSKAIQTARYPTCQRLLSAAVHDLRQKILIAGLDIAIEAANGKGSDGLMDRGCARSFRLGEGGIAMSREVDEVVREVRVASEQAGGFRVEDESDGTE